MGQLIDRILGAGDERSVDEYESVDFTNESISTETSDGVNCTIRVGAISTNQDLLQVKDALYAGDAIIVTVRNPAGGLSTGTIAEELEDAADQVGGDIARKGRKEFIVTPRGVNVGRETIGSY